mmetsp:Transcript_71237/g.144148  ORF Transcript_71237/g.144148 Transcript_71237/m.144148 type:complete len:217 (-) Transcript_71237:19-669(-)
MTTCKHCVTANMSAIRSSVPVSGSISWLMLRRICLLTFPKWEATVWRTCSKRSLRETTGTRTSLPLMDVMTKSNGKSHPDLAVHARSAAFCAASFSDSIFLLDAGTSNGIHASSNAARNSSRFSLAREMASHGSHCVSSMRMKPSWVLTSCSSFTVWSASSTAATIPWHPTIVSQAVDQQRFAWPATRLRSSSSSATLTASPAMNGRAMAQDNWKC